MREPQFTRLPGNLQTILSTATRNTLSQTPHWHSIQSTKTEGFMYICNRMKGQISQQPWTILMTKHPRINNTSKGKETTVTSLQCKIKFYFYRNFWGSWCFSLWAHVGLFITAVWLNAGVVDVFFMGQLCNTYMLWISRSLLYSKHKSITQDTCRKMDPVWTKTCRLKLWKWHGGGSGTDIIAGDLI